MTDPLADLLNQQLQLVLKLDRSSGVEADELRALILETEKQISDVLHMNGCSNQIGAALLDAPRFAAIATTTCSDVEKWCEVAEDASDAVPTANAGKKMTNAQTILRSSHVSVSKQMGPKALQALRSYPLR